MKYSLPITGCLCLSCRGESCVGGAGHQRGPLLCVSPHSFPQSLPPWRGWWQQRGEADPATGGVALASDGLGLHAWFHHCWLVTGQAMSSL